MSPAMPSVTLPPSPHPEFYISPGDPVSCLEFIHGRDQDLLLVGLTTGVLHIYNCGDWRKVEEIKVFSKGFLWVAQVDSDTFVCQGRFESVKIFAREGEGEEAGNKLWRETGNFAISHEGFCKGFVRRNVTDPGSKSGGNSISCSSSTTTSSETCLLFCPSSHSNILVSKLFQNYIRPVATLVPTKVAETGEKQGLKPQVGGVMSAAPLAELHLLLVAYEGGQVWLWDWSTCTVLARLTRAGTPAPTASSPPPPVNTFTPMAVTFDSVKNLGVLVGSEATLSIFSLNQSESQKQEEVEQQGKQEQKQKEEEEAEQQGRREQQLGEELQRREEQKPGSGLSLTVVKERQVTNPGMGIVRIRPDNMILATGGWDSRIRLFSWKYPEKCKPLAVLDFHTGSVEALAFTLKPLRGGRLRTNLLAAGSKDGKISLWSVYN